MISITSSARTIRRTFPGSTRVAATGSRVTQVGVEAAEAAGFGRLGLEPGPHREVLAGEAQVVDHRAHVQAGAAHQERPPSPRLDVGHRGAGRGLEPRDRPVLRRVGDVDQVVAHRVLF